MPEAVTLPSGADASGSSEGGADAEEATSEVAASGIDAEVTKGGSGPEAVPCAPGVDLPWLLLALIKALWMDSATSSSGASCQSANRV